MKIFLRRAAFLLMLACACLASRASQAAAPSFDCASARAPIERLICGSDALAGLDAALGRLFAEQQAPRDPQQRRAALEEQQRWLRQRLTDCAVAPSGAVPPPAGAEQCLIALYRARLAALGGTVREAPAAGRHAEVFELPAAGRHASVFEVPSVGRYAVRVESAVGVALALIDRMAGSLGQDGVSGGQDGRVDRILDRGSYKAMLTGPPTADGAARLRVEAFRELSGANPPRLVELKPVDSDLDDLTQRSWWLDIRERRAVFIEAAGRHLADLRLWRDGTWLDGVEPAAARIEPETGRPRQLRRISATLEPGLYLLTAYGGPAEAWAQQSDDKSFHLRFGVPRLAEAARVSQAASAFGFDRFLVPDKATYARLAIGQPAPAGLGVQRWSPGAPLSAREARAEIAKNSRDPFAELDLSTPGGEMSLLTVALEPGKPYRLDVIPAAKTHQFSGDGIYWIEAWDIGGSEDEADPTSLLAEQLRGQPERIIAETALKPTLEQPWQRRFNLLGEATLFVYLPTGEWSVTVAGDNVEAESRFEPLGDRPPNYRVPAFERDGFVWRLERGFYRLTLWPRAEKKGIARVALAPAGTDPGATLTPAPSLFALRAQTLADGAAYRLYRNEVPGVRRGVVIRKLPIDLAQDLPMTLRPAERVEVPVAVPVAGVLDLVDENGASHSFALDGATPVSWAAAGAGQHRVAVANAAEKPLALTLRLRPDALRPEAPLPALAADRFRAIPSFPTLASDRPTYLDLARQERRTFNVVVQAPALYRLETTGLLRTQGILRTRTVTALADNAAGGTGRNFLIQRYLRAGDYQLAFAATGRSAGHLGLRLKATPAIAAGSLAADAPSRATLPPGAALAWDFAIDHPGRYAVSALGLGRGFDLRVEDDDGWPVARPIVSGTLDQTLDPGRYRLIVLPQPGAARVVASLTEHLPPVEREGHGPHEIALGEPVDHEWLEPDPGGERVADQWRFTLPAPADVDVALSEGMVGALLRDGPASADATIAPAFREPGWNGPLAAGSYRIEVAALRPNNHLPYKLGVDSEQLVAGLSRTVEAPAEIPIALGGNDLIEIGSYGTADVRAQLYDDQNRLVGANDDRPDDWNFAITATLPPGKYTLQVDPAVAGEKARTRVELRRPAERVEPALIVPGNAAIADTDVHTWPLQIAGAGLLVIAANSADPLDLSLEQSAEAGVWRSVGRASGRATFLAVPVTGAGAPYRLRVWSPERRGLAVGITARLVSAPALPEARLAAGVDPARIDGLDPPLFVAAMQPATPGLLRVGKEIFWSAAAGEPAREEEIVIANAAPVWLLGRSGAMVRAARVAVDEPIKLTLPPAGATLAVKPDATPRLWIAQSRSGQPGLAFGGRANAQAATGIGDSSAVVLGRGGELALWNASAPGAALPITLRSLAFAAPIVADLPPGDSDLALAGQSARLLNLPPGAKRLRVRIPPQTAAILSSGDTPLAALWSEGESRDWTTELGPDRILLLNAAAGEARAAIGWTALPVDPFRLTVDRPLKRYEGAAGTLNLAVLPEAGAPAKLHVHGATAAAALITRDGKVLRGNDLIVDGPGTLSVAHGPGLVAAWIEPAAGTAAPAIAVAEPARLLPLGGRIARLAFEPKAPTLLRLASTVPLIASFIAPDGSRVTEVAADGARLARYLPAGRNLVELQSTAEGDLSGEAELLQSPVLPIDEGLGDKVLLSGGESRLYGFTLTREQTIGVGVRAAVDVANCRLFDAAGKELGSGVAQMHSLPAGAYLLAVDLPAQAAPVEIQPALVGARLPDSGPPVEIRQSYLRLVGRGPSE